MAYTYVSSAAGNTYTNTTWTATVTKPAGLGADDLVVIILDARTLTGITFDEAVPTGFIAEPSAITTNEMDWLWGMSGAVGAGPWTFTYTSPVLFLLAHWASVGYTNVASNVDTTAEGVTHIVASNTSTSYTGTYTETLHIIAQSGNDVLTHDGALTQRVYSKEALSSVVLLVADVLEFSATIPAYTGTNTNYQTGMTFSDAGPAAGPGNAGDAWE